MHGFVSMWDREEFDHAVKQAQLAQVYLHDEIVHRDQGNISLLMTAVLSGMDRWLTAKQIELMVRFNATLQILGGGLFIADNPVGGFLLILTHLFAFFTADFYPLAHSET